MTSETADDQLIRFSFGKNWQHFLGNLQEVHIKEIVEQGSDLDKEYLKKPGEKVRLQRIYF